MSVLLLILLSLLQGDASPAKWDCAKQPDRTSDKQITRLKPKEVTERVVSCKAPVLAGNIDATGTVIVQVLVNERGEVECLAAITGPPVLSVPALEAAKKWTFKPLVVDGIPKPFSGLISLYVGWNADEVEKHCPSEKRAEQIVGREPR